MALAGLSEAQRLDIVASSLKQMEVLGHRLRELIATQNPFDLMGYVYSLHLLTQNDPSIATDTEGTKQIEYADNLNNDETQFLLEYVHATLASTPWRNDTFFDEAVCAEIFEYAKELKTTAMIHAMMSSIDTKEGVFGSNTADVEFQAKSTWVTLRGNRYMALEGEFYAFVLGPHDKILRETYGINANEIAAGFQNIANSIQSGHSLASDRFGEQLEDAQAFAEIQGKSLREAFDAWREKHADGLNSAVLAFDDMLRGGICNISRHTTLPDVLLADLAFERGEETEFFAEGPYSGTPFRTLPVRKKPLIKIDNDYYAIDPCYIRDAGYRALLYNLLIRKPDYKEKFIELQKSMSESAFFNILSTHLKGAIIHREVYYKDTTTRQWAENDTLILIDDVLLLVEAKSGAAATIASPALDFARHALAVQELVIKAYRQCLRFFEYMQSADEVPIFKLENGKHVECARLRRSDYRVMFPIGLTVESFSPFSSMCKELSDIKPILGKHPFLSISIDDLFVLKRFLPTMGELAHYLEVRQIVAGMQGTNLFDEFDHLGAYIQKNRFDFDLARHLTEDKISMVVWDGMSEVIDRYFERENWDTQPLPMQFFHPELQSLLSAIDQTRAAGWLSIESHVRNFSDEGRHNLGEMLASIRKTLNNYPSRYFSLFGSPPLFIWLQRIGTPFDLPTVHDKSCASALATKANKIISIFGFVDPDGHYISARRFDVNIPKVRTAANFHIYEDAELMLRRMTLCMAADV
jgi:hypothetical protein